MDLIKGTSTVAMLDTKFSTYLIKLIASIPHLDTGMEISET